MTLYLPRSLKKPQSSAPPKNVLPQMEGARTALLAEDNADVAEVGADYLSQLGYRVRSVANVQAALAALRLDPQVDLVFSDIPDARRPRRT